MNRLQKNSFKITGFTIVELIVVIVVIAILATITLVSYNVIRDRAKAAAVASEITKVEEAFQLMASETFAPEWPKDNVYTGSGNPSFTDIMASTSPDAMLFKKYIPDVPQVSGMDLTWVYDNDKDSWDPTQCPKTNWKSVVLVISPIDEAIQQLVDNNMDDGNLECGRVTGSGTTLYYQLSYN
ncbi:MAG: prepilin-type N-terminal cleavage/methylation domain-containing protein, partial [bacterium]|nr:prepilin-type N-terminal cleavage/methylation domain-containing protein [bacterium]